MTRLELAAEAIRAGRPVTQSKPNNVHKRVEEDMRTYLLMCDLALAGYSTRGIVRELIQRGIRNRPGNPKTVANIMADDCYCTGVWHYNKRQGVAPKKLRKLDIERHREEFTEVAAPEPVAAAEAGGRRGDQ